MNASLDNKLYTYPKSQVLRNRFDIRNQKTLDKIERTLVAVRQRSTIPQGQFDLKHLQAIHHHLFQDLYPWAGQLRQVPMSKGSSLFMPPDRLEMGMQDIHNRLKSQNYLKSQERTAFAKEAGVIIGDINHLHPFRDGNGRTQLNYLKQLGQVAGHEIKLENLNAKQWIEASKSAHVGNYDQMSRAIESISHSKDRGRER